MDTRSLNYRILKAGICALDPIEFERYVADYFCSQGYTAETTPASYDRGVDIFLRKGDRLEAVVQCKRWSGAVGSEAIQLLLGAVAKFRASKGILVTTSDYTEEARRYADDTPIDLLTIEDLMPATLSLSSPVDAQDDDSPEPEPWPIECPAVAEMVNRVVSRYIISSGAYVLQFRTRSNGAAFFLIGGRNFTRSVTLNPSEIDSIYQEDGLPDLIQSRLDAVLA